jgi:hypothetical protein
MVYKQETLTKTTMMTLSHQHGRKYPGKQGTN